MLGAAAFIAKDAAGLAVVEAAHYVRNRPDARIELVFNSIQQRRVHMYIGGGILGTVLLILIVVWLVRRL